MRIAVLACIAACWLSRTAPAHEPASGDPGGAQTRDSEATFRCRELAQPAACAEALSMSPGDPVLLVAEADALLRSQRPGEAIGVYRNALRSGAPRYVVNPKIAEAQAHRRPLLAACEEDPGEVAERACESAWLPGAPDEVTVLKRRGLLLRREDRIAASLDAYMAAARLAPRDRGVARAILALSDGAGQNAASMTARGAALSTLGRRKEAIDSLHQALRLDPDLAEAKADLRRAERPARPPRKKRPAAALRPVLLGEARAGVRRAFSNEAQTTRSN